MSATMKKGRMMATPDERRVREIVSKALDLHLDRVVFFGLHRILSCMDSVEGKTESRDLTSAEKSKLAAIGILWGAGGVWLEGETLAKLDEAPTPAEGAQAIEVGVEIGTGLQHVPAVVLGPDDAQAVLALRGYRRLGERLLSTVQRLASEGLARPRSALEEQRENEEQKALAMIRDRRREGESEPDTLKRLLVDIDEWPMVRKRLREVQLKDETLFGAASRLAQAVTFQPALDASTPEIVRLCSGLPMAQAAAQFAHHIIFEVPKLKGAALAPSAPASEWMRAFCMRHHPAYQGDPIYQGDLIAWVMATMRKLAAERDNLQALATLREGCATAWGKAVDLLAPLAEELDDNLGHEGPLDVLHRVLAQRAEAEEHDLEAVPRIDVTSPMEQVVVDKTSPPITLETPRDVVRFLNRRLGLDFDTCEDVAAWIERAVKRSWAIAPIGGEYRWRGIEDETRVHRLYHDDTGALCYEGPGVKATENNRAHPYPGQQSVLFGDNALMLIASIVSIARAAERVLQKQERAVIERELRNLKSPFIPVGRSASNPFLASLAGKTMNEVVAALACRALDTDAAAGALAQLFPGTPVSFAGLADVASAAVKDLRAKREETEGALGRIAALLSVERQAPVAIIEREVELVRDAAHDRIEAVAEAARLRKVKRAAEVYFRAERAPSSARLDASAPRRALLDLLDPAAICWKAETGPGGGAGGVVLVSAKDISGVTISASGGNGGNATPGDASPPATTGSTDAKPAP